MFEPETVLRKAMEVKTTTRQMLNSLLLIVVIGAAFVLPVAVFAAWRVLL